MSNTPPRTRGHNSQDSDPYSWSPRVLSRVSKAPKKANYYDDDSDSCSDNIYHDRRALDAHRANIENTSIVPFNIGSLSKFETPLKRPNLDRLAFQSTAASVSQFE